MKIDIKNKWLQALRSGEYRKARYILKRHYSTQPRHCCLGVLCEVIKDEYPPATNLIAPHATHGHGKATLSKMGMLDLGTREYCDIPHPVMTRLARMNDGGAPFTKIADYIEKHL